MSFFKKIFGLNKLKDHSERINEYFANAVFVYLFKAEYEARLAALTAAKVAASIQRKSMLNYLSALIYDISNSELDKELIDMAKERLLSLKHDIEVKEWTLKDVIEAKHKLSFIHDDYAKALDKANPNIFIKYHPDLF